VMAIRERIRPDVQVAGAQLGLKLPPVVQQ
jgi:hypothetical protein